MFVALASQIFELNSHAFADDPMPFIATLAHYLLKCQVTRHWQADTTHYG